MGKRDNHGRGLGQSVAIQQAQLDRRHDGFDLAAGAEAFVDDPHVSAHRVDAQIERERDVVVAMPLRQELQDLALAQGQQIVGRGGSGANGGHFRGAATSSAEHELGYRVRHRHATAEQLADRGGQAVHVLAEQIAARAGLDHARDALLGARFRGDQQRGARDLAQAAELVGGGGHRIAERHDDGGEARARELATRQQERMHDPQSELLVAAQCLLGATPVESDEQHGNGVWSDSQVATSVRRAVTGSVRPEPRAEQVPVTCFELDTNRSREAVSVHRLRGRPGVSFWSITQAEGSRPVFSPRFRASYLHATTNQTGARHWGRGEERELRPGAVTLAQPGDVEVFSSVAEPVSVLTIYWEREVLEQAAAELGFSGNLGWQVPLLEGGPCSELFARLASLLELGTDAAAIEQAYCDLTVFLLVRAAAGDGPRLARGFVHPRIRRAAERLRSSLQDALKLADLAREIGLSKFHLVRCFHQAMGIAPHGYRKLARIHEARRLIEQGASIADAAAATGFADPPHLSRSFRATLGVTPSAWASAWRAADPWTERAPRTTPPPAC
jgi:AraC-like DNA-binding protein